MALFKVLVVKLPAAVLDGMVALRLLTEPLALVVLILLGVHGAADLFDDLLFTAVDTADRAVDATVRGALDGLAGMDWLQPDTAARWADDEALLIDIDRKEVLAVSLTLVAELLLDLLLLLWCMGGGADASTVVSGASVDDSRLIRGLRRARTRAPGLLRAAALVLAFVLGSLALGRWSSGRVASLLVGPDLGEAIGDVARFAGVLVMGLALLTLVPVVQRRALARAEATTGARWLRALVLPTLVIALLVAELTSGSSARGLWSLVGGGAA
ncbi:MAG: hypothetical protein ABIJ09_26110 [Pseudomonadota bacterium]